MLKNLLKKSNLISEEDYQFYNITYYGYILGGLDHLLFLFFFLFIGLMPMFYFNFLSVSVFALAFHLSNRNKLTFAFTIVLIEVFVHAYLCVYYLGFKGGFQYYLFALTPIIIFFPKWDYKIKLPLIAFLGINFIIIKRYFFIGTANHLFNIYLIDISLYFNVFASIAMFALIAFYYDSAVRVSKKELLNKNIQLSEKNTEINKQNNKLQNLTEKLKTANQAKDKFFSIIAHDIKNPLSAIFMNSELLILYFDKFNKKQVLDNLSKLNNSAKNIKELLDNLLEWARTQSNSIEFKPDYFDINKVINDNISLLNVSFKNKNLKISFEHTDQVIFFGDGNMINTVIRNILTNAVKFTQNDGKININSKITDNNLILEIEDSGIGMDEITIEKLFKIDTNVSRLGTAKEKGTGLGLILCKEFIEKHSGYINVVSKVGSGSKFIITLPYLK